jgi:hypothetical protein
MEKAPSAKFYVSMTDTFMSGWGLAKGKINKYLVVCDTWEEAEIIQKNALLRPEMKFVNITLRKPNYSGKRYIVSMSNFWELGQIWKEK